MRYSMRRTRREIKENNGFWISFSDLMSAMLLIFVLIMFYSVYQYFDMLEIKTAELLRQSQILTQRETELAEKTDELDSAQTALATQKEELTEAQDKLTQSETLLLAEQAKLLLREKEIEDLDTALASQKAELEAAQAALAEQQAELDAARTTVTQQQERLDEQQRQLDDLVGVRRRIIRALVQALKEANVNATVDPTTGAITLDSSILFEKSKSALSDRGKIMIDKFLPVYLRVLLSNEYRGNIAEIIIEGHTDSSGSYMSNLELSQDRAFSVVSYILSDECTALKRADKDVLRGIITANGRSESNLVYNEDGTENADASRRVEFKFRLHDDVMIEQMLALLEGEE